MTSFWVKYKNSPTWIFFSNLVAFLATLRHVLARWTPFRRSKVLERRSVSCRSKLLGKKTMFLNRGTAWAATVDGSEIWRFTNHIYKYQHIFILHIPGDSIRGLFDSLVGGHEKTFEAALRSSHGSLVGNPWWRGNLVSEPPFLIGVIIIILKEPPFESCLSWWLTSRGTHHQKKWLLSTRWNHQTKIAVEKCQCCGYIIEYPQTKTLQNACCFPWWYESHGRIKNHPMESLEVGTPPFFKNGKLPFRWWFFTPTKSNGETWHAQTGPKKWWWKPKDFQRGILLNCHEVVAQFLVAGFPLEDGFPQDGRT